MTAITWVMQIQNSIVLESKIKLPIVNHTKRNDIFVQTISLRTEQKENRLVIIIHLLELFMYR